MIICTFPHNVDRELRMSPNEDVVILGLHRFSIMSTYDNSHAICQHLVFQKLHQQTKCTMTPSPASHEGSVVAEIDLVSIGQVHHRTQEWRHCMTPGLIQVSTAPS